MTMWPSRTNLWAKKTRAVSIPVKKTNGHDKDQEESNTEDYIEDEDKIKHMEAEILSLKERLQDKCSEIKMLQVQLDENNKFMQKVIFELISLKSAPAPTPPTTRTQLENYLAKKNTDTKARLP